MEYKDSPRRKSPRQIDGKKQEAQVYAGDIGLRECV